MAYRHIRPFDLLPHVPRERIDEARVIQREGYREILESDIAARCCLSDSRDGVHESSEGCQCFRDTFVALKASILHGLISIHSLLSQNSEGIGVGLIYRTESLQGLYGIEERLHFSRYSILGRYSLVSRSSWSLLGLCCFLVFCNGWGLIFRLWFNGRVIRLNGIQHGWRIINDGIRIHVIDDLGDIRSNLRICCLLAVGGCLDARQRRYEKDGQRCGDHLPCSGSADVQQTLQQSHDLLLAHPLGFPIASAMRGNGLMRFDGCDYIGFNASVTAHIPAGRGEVGELRNAPLGDSCCQAIVKRTKTPSCTGTCR